jgi:hypothetical protein
MLTKEIADFHDGEVGFRVDAQCLTSLIETGPFISVDRGVIIGAIRDFVCSCTSS